MLINLFSVLGAPKNGSEMQNIFAGGVRNDAHKMQNIFVSVRSTMSAKRQSLLRRSQTWERDAKCL